MGLVFVDANVLYSRTLRDWMLLLSLRSGRFTVVTSRDVLVEVLANLREKHPEKDGGWIEMIHQKITESVHDVITDWPGGAIEGLDDPKDWHVVNAAKHAGVEVLVTADRDFSPIADELPFDLYTPDELFTLIAHNDPHAVREVVRDQVKYFKKKRELAIEAGKPAPRSLAEALRAAGAPKFAAMVEIVLRELSGLEVEPLPTMTAPTSRRATQSSEEQTEPATPDEGPMPEPASTKG